MKSTKRFVRSILSMFVYSITIVIHTIGMTFHAPEPAFTLNGRLNCPMISVKGGTAFLQLSVTSPSILVSDKRKLMNLSIVIDRSGSMSEQRKMEYAKKAFSTLIDQLKPNDILSLVIYDDVVTVLRRSSRVGNDKQSLKRMLDEVYPRGSTNLGGGLMEGLKQAEAYEGKEYVNRVILLSDGLANVGMTNPVELNRIARMYRSKSISVSTMGVGLDYNENLMMGISETSGGNYYFIEQPHSLASIVRQEFDMVSSIVAQNGAIYLSLGENVRIKDVVGCEYKNENNRFIIPIGDLYANETREFTVELSIPEGTGKRMIASGDLRYERANIIAPFPKFSTTVSYTMDYAEVEKNRDIQSQAKADIAVSARKVEEAMQAMDRGNQAEADMMLSEAKDMISTSPAASSMGASGESVRMQMGRIESYQKLSKEDSLSGYAKKSIQYENYKTRKNK